MTTLTIAQFDALFDRFAGSPTATRVFRWEGLQHYEVDYDEPSWRAFREGTTRPDRSIRTDPWLARIARSTLAGKMWERVRGVAEPLSEYTRWELIAYGESAAAGEKILITDDEDAKGTTDFWLFDGSSPGDRYAVMMFYDEHGVPLAFGYRDDPAELAAMREFAEAVTEVAEPLNAYLARHRAAVSGVA